ncbi:MAG: response regulator, partial [Paenibacillaceae bacterium]|nr:response regulator [Paenibacillaceae bacterium]
MLIILRRLLSQVEGVTISGSFMKGADALDWVRSEAVDIAFVDIQMAGEDGIELAKQMQAIRRKMKIVFVTSHKEYALDAFELGAVDYIVKPVILERLMQTIERVAGERGISVTSEDDAANRLMVNGLGGMTAHSRHGDVKWISGKSAELFAYLLMHRDKGVARNEILDDLFDGLTNRQTNIYLNTAVYQLRKTLKLHGLREAVVSLNDRYKLCTAAVDADFILFEDRMAAIGEITASNYQQACEIDKLYAGDLFGEKYSWSIAEKERLIILHTSFSKRLGKWLLGHGHTELAALVVNKLIARNEMDEEANALLLSLYAAAKDRHSLIARYKTYSSLLQEELDIR